MTKFHSNKSQFRAVLITAICVLLPVTSFGEPTLGALTKLEGHCDPGLHKQPNGPMAVINFCEDALGNYIGLVFYEPMGGPVPVGFHNSLSKEEKETYYNVWSPDNRMWQEPIWASDVTSYAWSEDGRKLFVATSEIYGSGSLYELDLIRRKYKQIAPETKQHSTSDPGPGYLITNISTEILTYQLSMGVLPDGADIQETRIQVASATADSPKNTSFGVR